MTPSRRQSQFSPAAGILPSILATLITLASAAWTTRAAIPPDAISITAPPASFFELVRENDREPARAFYKKYLDIDGMPVVSAAAVDDAALRQTRSIVKHLLAGRADVVETMVKNKMYLIIIGRDQVYTDMPEYRNHPNPAFQNERVRGTGGKPTSFGEENLLCLPLDRYDDESICVHEFCHTIDSTLRSIDTAWTARRNAVYRDAIARGLWQNTYASGNPTEFWAEICQSYFDCNRVNNWNHGPVGTREQLQAYDPKSYELVRDTFQLSGEKDWRYQWLQKLPNVTPPPARYKIDPYYTKFTWAREFVVVGKSASDETLLEANDTIRKMFAYRHDILKAFIADGIKLVVLGPGERLADLPEMKSRPAADGKADLVQLPAFRPESKLLVVQGGAAPADESQVIRVFARALHDVAGTRPADPNWNNRGNAVQQYELRVKRVDREFDERLAAIHKARIGKGPPAASAQDRVEYWISGVLAYFNAAGPGTDKGEKSINTRESLKELDPELYQLVNETMAYEGHQDWRYRK